MKNVSAVKVLKVAWPVLLGYIPVGIACGVFAQKAGLSIFEITGMSFLVYAGSSQFIGIAMMMHASSVISIVLTTFIVNLRHLLFSLTLSNQFEKESKMFRAIYAYSLTDETFALNLNAFKDSSWDVKHAMAVHVLAHFVWIASSAAGFYFGEMIAIDTGLVGYGLTAMFIGLWSFYLSDKKMIIAGILSGFLAVLLSVFVGYRMHIILSAVTISAFFAYLEIKTSKQAVKP